MAQAWPRQLPTGRLPPPGPVTNAFIMLAPVSMLSSDFRPSLPLPHFNKHLLGAEHGDEQRRGGLALRLGLHQQVLAPQVPCPGSASPACLFPAGRAGQDPCEDPPCMRSVRRPLCMHC